MDEDDSIYSVKHSKPRHSEEHHRVQRNGYNRRQRAHKNRIISRMVIFVLVLLAIILFFVTSIFGSVVVKLELDSILAGVDSEFSAAREISNIRDIKYRKVGPLSYKASVSIPASSSQPKVTKAIGTLTAYNTNKSGSSLALIKNTRFTLPDGRIYRLGQSVVVPGGKKVGGEFQPGSLDVSVASDKAGLQTNVDAIGTKFSIPGLSSSGAYRDSYALSKTKITGGYSGQKYIIDNDVRKKEIETLRDNIKNKIDEILQEELDKELPTKWVAFDDAKFYEYEEPEETDGDGSVSLSINAVVYAVAFPESKLAELIARENQLIQGNDNSAKLILGSTEGLDFTFINRDIFEVDIDNEFVFSISGDTFIQFDVDDVLLFASTMGKNKDEFDTIIKSDYTYIRDYDLDFFPFWKSTIPYNDRRFETEKTFKTTK